ncbi:MAG: hypothetical protein MZU97_25850 [Bacillus subtilis]|nr:hypothetical protein [Bacillus subtilis]
MKTLRSDETGDCDQIVPRRITDILPLDVSFADAHQYFFAVIASKRL